MATATTNTTNAAGLRARLRRLWEASGAPGELPDWSDLSDADPALVSTRDEGAVIRLLVRTGYDPRLLWSDEGVEPLSPGAEPDDDDEPWVVFQAWDWDTADDNEIAAAIYAATGH